MRKFGRFLGFPGFRVLKSGRLLFWLLGFTRNHPNQGARWFLEVASFRWFPVFFVSAPVLYRRSSKWRARADIFMAGLVSCRLLCRAGSQKGSAPGHLPEYRTETESHRDYTGPVPQGSVRAAIHKPRPEGGCCRAQGASCA